MVIGEVATEIANSNCKRMLSLVVLDENCYKPLMSKNWAWKFGPSWRNDVVRNSIKEDKVCFKQAELCR